MLQKMWNVWTRTKDSGSCHKEKHVLYVDRCPLSPVTPNSVLHPRYSSRATVLYTSRARAWRLKEHTKRPGSFIRRSAECQFIQTSESPYLPNCYTRTSAQAGGKLPYRQWSQCPTDNHQEGGAGEVQEQTECFIS